MAHSRIDDALKNLGAVLLRDKKHRVYRLPNGRKFVVSSSPSDRRWEDNALTALKFIAGGPVKPSSKKASPEVRAERRSRPGRAQATGRMPGMLQSAMTDAGLEADRLRQANASLEKRLESAKFALSLATKEIAAREAQLYGLRQEHERFRSHPLIKLATFLARLQ